MNSQTDELLPQDDQDPTELEDSNPLEFDDDQWDAFLPDDDQQDPLPEPGDFWLELNFSSKLAVAA